MGSTRFHLAICLGLVVSVACASSGGATAPTGDAGTDAGVAADGGAGSGPGRIYLSTTTISNQSGKILLATVGNTSRLCFSISSNSVAMPATAMTDAPGGNDPCAGSTSATVFDAGATTVTVAIYTPGSQDAGKSVIRTVTVAGDTTENIDGTLLSE